MAVSATLDAGRWRGTRPVPGDEADFLRLRRDPQVALTLSADGLPPGEASGGRVVRSRRVKDDGVNSQREGYPAFLYSPTRPRGHFLTG